MNTLKLTHSVQNKINYTEITSYKQSKGQKYNRRSKKMTDMDRQVDAFRNRSRLRK